MDEYKIYLFQYKKNKEMLNRFYAHSKISGTNEDLLISAIDKMHPNKKSSLEDIANKIDKTLEIFGFIEITGIKSILPSYKKIIGKAYAIVINKDRGNKLKLSAWFSQNHYFSY